MTGMCVFPLMFLMEHCHSGMRHLAQARNPYSRWWLWIPGSIVSLAPRNDDFIFSRMQSAPVACPGGHSAMGLAEQLGELFGDGAAEFLGIDDGDGAAVITRDVVTAADRDQFDRRAGLDFLDDMAQMALQVIAGIDRQRRIIDRRAVGNHHQDLALLGAAQ